MLGFVAFDGAQAPFVDLRDAGQDADVLAVLLGQNCVFLDVACASSRFIVRASIRSSIATFPCRARRRRTRT